MITENDVVQILLDQDETNLVKGMGFFASTKGRSNFVFGVEREEKRLGHNITGQAGELALNIYVFNKRKTGNYFYVKNRMKANANPTKGDGGRDIIDSDIDIKTSMINVKNIKQDPMEYNLSVPPREYKENWIYVSGIIFEREKSDKQIPIKLMGWAKSSDLKWTTKGTFKGKYTRKNRYIRPFPIPNIWPTSLKSFIII